MKLKLENKCALVTAASQGLGRASAEALAQEGAKVIICSRNEKRIIQTANEITKKTGNKVTGLVCDLTKFDDIKKMIQSIYDLFENIDILIFNHGNLPPGSFENLNINHWRNGLSLSLWPAIHLCQSLIPKMKIQNWGRIIFISSIYAKEPDPRFIISSSYRAGLLGFAKCLASELAINKVTVNTVLAGYYDTPLLREIASKTAIVTEKTVETVLTEWTKTIPTKFLPDSSSLGELVAWLASENSFNITGTAITSDGGLNKVIF